MDQPNSRNWSPWWVLFVTLFGGMFLLRGSAPGPADKDSANQNPKVEARAAASAASEGPREERLRSPLYAFLGINPTATHTPHGRFDLKLSLEASGQRRAAHLEMASGAADPAPKGDQPLTFVDQLHERVGKLEFLIVTVADPLETQSNYRFDLQVETLHRALATEGYSPDAFYLPWQKGAKGQEYRHEPGVLLYRRTHKVRETGKAELILVYLVGELPTSGIHKEAFLMAVDEIAALSSDDGRARQPLMICGPTFSGSAYSLAAAIRLAHDKPRVANIPFHVVTGSASSIQRETFLEMATTPDCQSSVTFHATVNAGTLLEEALRQVIATRNPGKLRIAWLRESGTGYGIARTYIRYQARQQEQVQLRQKSQTQPQLPASREDQVPRNVPAPRQPSQVPGQPQPPPKSKGNQSRREPQIETIDFTVPLNIARVRSSYESDRRQEQTSQGKALPDRYRLPIPFDAEGSFRDLPPVQTPNMTAPSEEVVLGQILATIRSEGIKFVGISMTDVRDFIFLAELIREHCPNTQLLLTTADLLDLHTEYRAALSGALVASSHSLRPEEQDWCFPFQGRQRKIVLSNNSFYGLYNSVVLLRYIQGHPEAFDAKNGEVTVQSAEGTVDVPPLVGYGAPLVDVPPTEKTSFAPPVWVSMLSPTGIWPLEAYPDSVLRQPNEGAEKSAQPRSHVLQVRVDAHEWSHNGGGHSYFNDRIAPSSLIAMGGWILAGGVYLLAVSGHVRGNWVRPLQIGMHEDPVWWVNELRSLFRAIISTAIAGVLFLQFALLSGIVIPPMFNGWSTILNMVLQKALFIVCVGLGSVAIGDMLIICLAGLLARVRQRGDRSTILERRTPLALQILALAPSSLLIMCVLHHTSQPEARPSALLWFSMWTDLWNGVSLLLTAQLIAAAFLVLGYGFLLQLTMVDGHHLIPSPFWPLSPAPRSERRAARVNQLRLEAARRSLVFPIVGRLQHGKSIAISVIGLVAAAAWLALLWSQTANIEPFPWVRAVVFPAFMLGCAFWSWRFMKTIVLVQDFLKTLRKLMRRFAPGNSVAAWTKIIGRNRDDRIHNLQSLLFTDRPKVNDARLREKRIALDEVQQALRSTHVLIAAADVAAAEEDVVAQHLILYVRQFFVHAKSLGIGLCTSGILLFLAANSFPFNSQPLMQLTTSLMLVAIGSMVVWYYVQFDRNEIISLIVGSTPHHVEWNWSLLQTVVPAGGLALVALLSQAFPEMWHWLRDLLGPVMRTSG